MRYFLDILQAAGLGSATGIRPFLPALAAGALGRADAGVDFEGTSFAFLESPIFLAALVLGVLVSVILARSRPDDDRSDTTPPGTTAASRPDADSRRHPVSRKGR